MQSTLHRGPFFDFSSKTVFSIADDRVFSYILYIEGEFH